MTNIYLSINLPIDLSLCSASLNNFGTLGHLNADVPASQILPPDLKLQEKHGLGGENT